jgi:hypothetical protein
MTSYVRRKRASAGLHQSNNPLGIPADLRGVPSRPPTSLPRRSKLSVLVESESTQDAAQRRHAPDIEVVSESEPPQRRIAGPVAVTIAIGLFLIALAGNVARSTNGTVDLLLWPGIVLLTAAPVWGALAPNVERKHRIASVVMASVAVTFSRILLYPTDFAYHDELLHLNSLRLIQEDGHLFNAVNSLLPVTTWYPGLEIATDGMHRVTGLSVHVSASILLVLGRLAMALALVRILEIVTGSARTACIGALIYAANPQFTFFNSQFSYQSIALPLSMYAVYLFGTRDKSTRLSLIAPVLALTASAVSHHLTTMGAVLVFVGWWFVSRFIRRNQIKDLGLMAILAVAVFAAWTYFAREQVLIYVEEIFKTSYQSISGTVGGERESNKLFADDGGGKTPLWQRIISFGSVGILMLWLLPSLWHGRKIWNARNAAGVALLGVAALYPLIPASHLTVSSAEVGDRSSGFIFVGVAFAIGTWLAAWRTDLRFRIVAFAGVVVLLTGAAILGAGPRWHQVPGPYLVAADNRAVDANGLAMARWMRTYLPPENRVMVDRVNGLLTATYGHQHVFRHLADRIDMGTTSTLLLRGPQGDYDKELIKRANLDYVVADRRLATGLPRFGVYIETGETGTIGNQTQTVPPPEAFTKFDNVRGAERIYDNGTIALYDVRSLKQ